MRNVTSTNLDSIKHEIALLSGTAWAVGSFEVTPAGKILFFVTSKHTAEGGDHLFSFEVTKQFADDKVREVRLRVSNQFNREICILRDSKDVRDIYSRVSSAILRTASSKGLWIKYLQAI